MSARLSIPALRRGLLAWYDTSGRKLPWREPARAGDPYAVWISEIMLQQTRVAAVIPYYERWLRRFPDATSLAKARPGAVLAQWSGLGYYRRAANLHQAARRIAAQHGGRLPLQRAELMVLPGIGSYTAAAILSIAANEALAAVDGNVVRIVARVTGEPATPATALATAQAWLDPRRPGDFNQALMDLGAMLCLPRAPHCAACPIRPHCRTRGTLPPVRARRPALHVRARYALHRRGRRIWLRRRNLKAAIMPGMWELPAGGRGEFLGAVRHAITFRAIAARVYAAPGAPPEGGRWVSAHAARRLPLTGLARKILRRYAGWDLG